MITDQELIERRACPDCSKLCQECAKLKREVELLRIEAGKWATACQSESLAASADSKMGLRLLRLMELMVRFALKIKVLKLKS